MGRLLVIALAGILSCILAISTSAQNAIPNSIPPFVPPTQLHLTYPPLEHTTNSDRLFFIGTAPQDGKVTINNQQINRSPKGHFAPSFPLQLGENNFQIKYMANDSGNNGNSQNNRPINIINVKVKREARITPPPQEFGLIKDSLFPKVDIARQPNERICFDAIATPKAKMLVKVGGREIPMLPRRRNVQLPPNSSVLTGDNNAQEESPSGYFRGCTTFEKAGKLGQPEYEMSIGDRRIREKAIGKVEILSAQDLQIAEVTANEADARTGASTDFSRLTPLPKSTKAAVTGKQGNWLRLDYGGWVRDNLVQVKSSAIAPHSIVRGIDTKVVTSLGDPDNVWTEVKIPLELPVPISIIQGDRLFTLTLHNVTAQTDTVLISPDTIVNKLEWSQTEPEKVTYTVSLKTKQQWGYKVRYQGTNLIISLKHPPKLGNRSDQSLTGVKILLDAGHGSSEDLGARGPTGYPEKDVTLITSQLLQKELQQRGAKVIMTRTDDSDILLEPRVAKIKQEEPNLAISIHYNALPDHGDAENTMGVGSFWYNPQSQDFAKFINTYLVQKLNRRDYGVYWNNLALIRPTTAPAVLLELGFMINPDEFEWIINPEQQQLLAKTLADGITEWITNAAL